MAAVLQPLVDFAGVRVCGSAFVMEMPMHWECFLLFPALHRSDVAFQVCGNFFPRVEPLTARVVLGRGMVHGEGCARVRVMPSADRSRGTSDRLDFATGALE